MSSLPRLFFRDTHAYPGCRAMALGFATNQAHTSLPLEFSDGTMGSGHWLPNDDGTASLEAQAHVTARGSTVSARHWLLLPDGDEWKVVRRLP